MHLCIDIGTNSIRVLEKSADGQVLKWGKLDRPGKPFHMSISPMNESDVAEHLRLLLAKMGSTSNEATVAIPAFLTFTAIAESSDPAAIPAASGTFKVDSINLDQGKFFLTAVPNDVIERYGRILGAVGVQSADWESKSAILAKNFGISSEPTLIVDADDRSTTFVVAQNGKPVFVEQTNFPADVIMNKFKKIKNIKWVTKNFFYSF